LIEKASKSDESKTRLFTTEPWEQFANKVLISTDLRDRLSEIRREMFTFKQLLPKTENPEQNPPPRSGIRGKFPVKNEIQSNTDECASCRRIHVSQCGQKGKNKFKRTGMIKPGQCDAIDNAMKFIEMFWRKIVQFRSEKREKGLHQAELDMSIIIKTMALSQRITNMLEQNVSKLTNPLTISHLRQMFIDKTCAYSAGSDANGTFRECRSSSEAQIGNSEQVAEEIESEMAETQCTFYSPLEKVVSLLNLL
jgi:hypothetical protein